MIVWSANNVIYSAVTAACFLVKRAHFNAVNGLNEKELSVAFNDVDFCLKVKGLGVNNVYCAEAELFHHESVSRGLDISPEKAARFNRELSYLQTTWCAFIKCDPAYNPNLTLKRENFSIKTTTELKIEWQRHSWCMSMKHSFDTLFQEFDTLGVVFIIV